MEMTDMLFHHKRNQRDNDNSSNVNNTETLKIKRLNPTTLTTIWLLLCYFTCICIYNNKLLFGPIILSVAERPLPGKSSCRYRINSRNTKETYYRRLISANIPIGSNSFNTGNNPSSLGGHSMNGMFFNKRIDLRLPSKMKNSDGENKDASKNIINRKKSQAISTGPIITDDDDIYDDEDEPNVAKMRKAYIKDLKKFGIFGFKNMLEKLTRFKIETSPACHLKLRKRIDFFKTLIVVGMDYNVQTRIAQFKSSWTDKIIGARLALKGRELQLSKSWNIALGERDDISTKLKFRVVLDTKTGTAYYRCGFRTETVKPMNLKKGIIIKKQISATKDDMFQVEYLAKFHLPEPQLEYSNDENQFVVALGDLGLSLDELNLLINF